MLWAQIFMLGYLVAGFGASLYDDGKKGESCFISLLAYAILGGLAYLAGAFSLILP